MWVHPRSNSANPVSIVLFNSWILRTSHWTNDYEAQEGGSQCFHEKAETRFEGGEKSILVSVYVCAYKVEVIFVIIISMTGYNILEFKSVTKYQCSSISIRKENSDVEIHPVLKSFDKLFSLNFGWHHSYTSGVVNISFNLDSSLTSEKFIWAFYVMNPIIWNHISRNGHWFFQCSEVYIHFQRVKCLI